MVVQCLRSPHPAVPVGPGQGRTERHHRATTARQNEENETKAQDNRCTSTNCEGYAAAVCLQNSVAKGLSHFRHVSAAAAAPAVAAGGGNPLKVNVEVV